MINKIVKPIVAISVISLLFGTSIMAEDNTPKSRGRIEAGGGANRFRRYNNS